MTLRSRADSVNSPLHYLDSNVITFHASYLDGDRPFQFDYATLRAALPAVPAVKMSVIAMVAKSTADYIMRVLCHL